jgi:S-DNA-T family DNA segregation ATPase FtsK/SpoIIIE
MNNSPENLRIVMIDPKMVELVRFNGLPHLVGKVETDLEKINVVLRWVVEEMQRRYKLLEDLRSRDIESYNRKAHRRKDYEMLPRLVVMIDELADLMMNSAEQTESTVVRLAQMARATGIHLVIATQRPSTDVVTGLIKANFPARLSFAVASGVDSRVILDFAGAETLLGKGDMLFLNPEEGTPLRAQGVLISDQEIDHIIQFWQNNWELTEEEIPWEVMMEEEAVLADRDDLVEDAIELLRLTGRASTSMIQRRLKIGYPRAARLMDELEDLGIVGPSQGGGRERDILLDLDEDFE